MTPFEIVSHHYRVPEKINGIPFVPHPLQIEVINDLAPRPNSGNWSRMATGKTFMATFCALYWKVTAGLPCVIIMPPILIRQWARWLAKLEPVNGARPLTICAYQGTPAKRHAMSLDADFVLVGIQIFKRDHSRFVELGAKKRLSVFVDEATMISNRESGNHEAVYDFAIGHVQQPMSGTPANKPTDAYALMKMAAPGVYESQLQFENLHVKEWDYYKRPAAFSNLDLLNKNLQQNAARLLYTDLYPKTELPHFIPKPYDLSSEHYKLFTKLAREQILALPDGGKIEAATVQKLRHALSQIICNWSHFSGNPKHVSASTELIEETLNELGDGKLLVFANYKITVSGIVNYFNAKGIGAVAINSEVTEKQKLKNVDRFMEEAKTRLMVAHYLSAGKGLDGLQYASSTCMFIELCQQPRDFEQAYERLGRPGQTQRVKVLIPYAEGTLQYNAFRNLMENDKITNQVIRNRADLEDLIFGRR